MTRFVLCFFALCFFVSSFSLAAAAQEHALIAEARNQYEEGEVEQALETVSRAEHTSDLSRENLLSLLELRILILRARGDDEQVSQELQRLASIAPDRAPADEFPPALRERLAGVRATLPGGLSVQARANATATGVEVTAEARNDVASVVREVRVYARAPDSAWSDGLDRLDVPVTSGRVDYYAVAVGPGGAPVAEHGSAEEPRVFLFPELRANGSSGEAVSPWVWVGITAGAAAVVAAVVVVVVLATSSDNAQPTAPHLAP